jgi:hypothetical protein
MKKTIWEEVMIAWSIRPGWQRAAVFFIIGFMAGALAK